MSKSFIQLKGKRIDLKTIDDQIHITSDENLLVRVKRGKNEKRYIIISLNGGKK
ncbi:hypothetical protein LCGC14_1363250 [marine sediment metagenome]|uniref:Uncharacterized protein n=1 Tax=marine sediment metagenome TaxID=412755 RepID=A0A0F9N9Q4_9ZZZZ